MEHMTSSHYVLHSAQAHAGVMILIHKRMAPTHRVTWRVVHPGRLVHARLYGYKSHINIIGYYQQAWQPQQTEACLRKRAALNTKLDQLLTECSGSQLLFLGGDFNTDLPPDSPYVGAAMPPACVRNAPRQPDRQLLQELVGRHGICALNTLQKWRPTYQGKGPQGEWVQSRIDFLFMKHKHVDQASRSCTYDTDFVLTAHRSNAQHLPMHFHTRAQWTPWQAERSRKVYSMRDRQAPITCRAQNEAAWNHWAIDTNQRITEQTTVDGALHELCRSTTAQLAKLPTTAAVQVPSLHQDATWTKGVASMWRHYKAMRNLRGAHTRNIFHAWRHMTCFQRASRTFRTEARARKRYLVDQFLREAGECAIKGDVHQWYRRIRYICPKAKVEKFIYEMLLEP